MNLSTAARTARKSGRAVVFTYESRTVRMLPTGRMVTASGISLAK